MSEKAPATSYSTESTQDFFDTIQAEITEQQATEYRQNRVDHISSAPEAYRQQVVDEFRQLDEAYAMMADPGNELGGVIDERLAEMDAKREGAEVLDTNIFNAAIANDPILRRLDTKARQIASMEGDVSKAEARQKNEQELFNMMSQVMNGDFEMQYIDSDGQKTVLESEKNAYDHRLFDYIASHTTKAEAGKSNHEKLDVADTTSRALGAQVAAAAGVHSPGPEIAPGAHKPSSAEGSATDQEKEGAVTEGSATELENPTASTETPPATEESAETETETTTLKAEDVDWIRTIESSVDATPKDKMMGYQALRGRLEYEGYSSEEVAKMLDAARNEVKGLQTEVAPAAQDTDTAEEDMSEEDGLPTDEELAEYEEVQEQLRQAGALKQPSARKLRRTVRRLRRNKARKDSRTWADAQNEATTRSASEADRMKKEKELFAKYRKEYFSAKGVKDTLLNRMRYQFGRDAK